MSAHISSPETICLQCGDRGFTNAFVYCVRCLDVAVHRYCLDVIPETVDEFVRWICEDCDVNLQNCPSVPKHDSGRCNSIDRTADRIIGHSRVGTMENDLVAVNNIDEPIYEGGSHDDGSGSEREQCENNSSERPHEQCTNIDVSDCAMQIDQCESDSDPCRVDLTDRTVIVQLPDENKLDLQNQRSEDSKIEVSEKEQCENNSSERPHEEGTNIDVKSVSDSEMRENSDPIMQIDQCDSGSDPCTVDQRDRTVIVQLPEENKLHLQNQRSEDRKSEVSEKEQCENNSSERPHEEGTNIDVKSVSDSEMRENSNPIMQIDQCDSYSDPCTVDQRDRTVIVQLPKENKLDLQNQRSEDRKSEVSEKEQCENNSFERPHEEGTNIDVGDCAKLVIDSDFRENNNPAMQIDHCELDSDPCTVDQKDRAVIVQLSVENKLGSENQRSEDRKSEVSEERISNDLDVSSKVYDCHMLSEPVITPVWRGSFDIRNRNGDILDELVAHMSSRACHKVYDEACRFQPVLHLEILPKSDVWPKSFETSESVENNIALYFFPSDIRSERIYEHMVDEMVQEALAMRAVVENAELLVFASTELPTLYWRFQGRYYLWGVFRAKQHREPCSQSYREESRYNTVINADLPEDTGFSWDMMTTRNPLAILLDQNRLTGSNYADWKRNLNIVLTSENLTHVLNEEPPQLPADYATREVKDAYKSWFDHDSLAKRYILASVEDRFQKQHHSLLTSKDIMSSLKEMIVLENFPAIHNAMTALTCKMAPGTRVYDHVVKMIGYINELEMLGAEVDKEIKMDPVLFSLPKAFNQVVLNVSGKNSVMTLSEVRGMLQRAKDWMKKDEPVVVAPEVVVESPKSKSNKKRKRKSWNKENPKQGSFKKRVQDKSKDDCFHCGKKGHWRRNCREYLARLRNN